MKKCLQVLFIVVLFTSFLVTVPDLQAKEIGISLAHWGPEDSLVHWGLAVPWKKLVEERTNGRVKVTIYPAQSLAKTRDLYPAAVNGIADVTIGFMSHYAGHSPRSTVLELPFIGVTSAAVATHVIQDLSKTLVKPDYHDVHVLWLFSYSPYQLHTTKPVRRLEDMKGLKIRTAGEVQSNAVKLLGGTPVAMSPTDAYMSLEKGIVDGTLFPWEAVWGFKLAEVVKYHSIINIQAGGPFYVVMNLDKWKSLPADIQNIIDEISGDNAVDFTIKAIDKADEQGINFAKENHNEIIDISKSNIIRWKEKCKPIYDNWLKERQKEGIDGQALLDRTYDLIEKYSN